MVVAAPLSGTTSEDLTGPRGNDAVKVLVLVQAEPVAGPRGVHGRQVSVWDRSDVRQVRRRAGRSRLAVVDHPDASVLADPVRYLQMHNVIN